MTRAEAEDFLFHEAALLDDWKLDEWLELLTDDARYLVPSNDAPDADPASSLFLIADDIARIRGRVARLKDPMAHVEFPHSRTRRLITNVRLAEPETGDRPRLSAGDNRGLSPVLEVAVEANFTVHRFRRGEQVSQYVGRYRYRLRMVDGEPRIARREAILDSHELGSLGAVSFIL
ncbi:MAG TPA: aromatic-ring-hydroxylating dioxygenase subunit beta [Usitatibacter sp.]|nr:aromatic-ring-hydroxylating dioxygenase subunit beta [Usitatibacter sp.]